MTTSNLKSLDSADPFVTIAIPTFNRASWLKDCVVAALAQTYARFEVLVLDNASTDNTSEELRAINDQRLRVVRHEKNIGGVGNLIACLEEARGDYVVFVPDDDWIAPWMLERCASLVRREPGIPIVLALSDTHLVDECRLLPARASAILATGVWSGVDVLREFLQSRISPVMCTILVRVDAMRAMGGFPPDLPHAGDIAVWVSLLLTGRAGLVNESCGAYRVHGETQSLQYATDLRLKDLSRVADLVGNLAEREISDAQTRRDIQREAKAYFASNALDLIAARRKSGDSLAEVFPDLWRLRADLSQIGLRAFLRSGRPLAIVVFPRAMTRFIRHVIGLARRLKSRGARGQRYGCQEIAGQP